MADKHPSGNPRLVEQHKNIQQHGDEELAGTAHIRPEGKAKKQRRPGNKKSETAAETEASGSRPTGGSSVGP